LPPSRSGGRRSGSRPPVTGWKYFMFK
jgi:hypothetical protein